MGGEHPIAPLFFRVHDGDVGWNIIQIHANEGKSKKNTKMKHNQQHDQHPTTTFAAIVQTPVYPKTAHQFRPDPAIAVKAKPKKRDNIFSKSRDTREDRGMREIKTSHEAQSFSRGK